MENTKTNKQKFIALYWGQRVAKTSGYKELKTVSDIVYKENGMSNIFCTEYVELKPLSLIKDDDLGNIARFYNQTATNVYLDDEQLTFDYLHGDETHSAAIELNSGYCLDYLRSNGYAIAWMGLSVEKLQEYGWIKLKTD